MQKVEDEWSYHSKDIPISVVSTCMLKCKTEVKPVRNLLLMLVKYNSSYDRLIRAFCFLIRVVSAIKNKIKVLNIFKHPLTVTVSVCRENMH